MAAQDKQDGGGGTWRTLAVAALTVPLGLVVTVAVCYLALGWSGNLSPETHSTAVAMQGVRPPRWTSSIAGLGEVLRQSGWTDRSALPVQEWQP